MVIRASSAGTVRQLLDELAQTDPVRREAAVARLRVLGTRAVPAVVETLEHQPDPAVRESALRVFEGLNDPRAADAAVRALTDPDADVRVAAVGVLRPWLLSEPATRVLEALSHRAVDDTESPRVRAAALEALRQLPDTNLEPPGAMVPVESSPGDLTDPAAVEEWLAARPDAPLSVLHELIVRARRLEAADGDAARRARWQMARAAIHAALARRGSRVALYDLRETFERAAAPLPIDFLTAASQLGDQTVLEPLAMAWSAAPASEVWWREHLAAAAAAIVRRVNLTRRHAAVRRVHARWPGFLR